MNILRIPRDTTADGDLQSQGKATMYNGDPKPFNASNQHGSWPFPGAGVVMTFSPVVNRKPGAKPMAPKGLMINTNHALASLR